MNTKQKVILQQDEFNDMSITSLVDIIGEIRMDVDMLTRKKESAEYHLVKQLVEEQVYDCLTINYARVRRHFK